MGHREDFREEGAQGGLMGGGGGSQRCPGAAFQPLLGVLPKVLAQPAQ